MASHSVSEPLEFVTGSHTFEISRYSVTSEALTNKSYIKSDTFHVGGHDWAIKYYPHGLDEASSDCISLSVELISSLKPAVQAIFDFRLEDRENSGWSTETITSSTIQTFIPDSDFASRGFSHFIKRSDLEASNYLKDDTLMIKCILWVVSSETMSASINKIDPLCVVSSETMSTPVNKIDPLCVISSETMSAPINEIEFYDLQIHKEPLSVSSTARPPGYFMESIGRFN